MALTAPTMSRPVGVAPVELDQPAPEPGERGTERAGVLLLGALLAAVLYAIFAHGAAPQPEEARLQVGLSLVAVVALAALLWGSGLRVAAPAAAWAGLGLLAAFAAWSGLSMAWTVFPSATWTELNRAIAYALVVGLALAAGSWYPRAVSRAALGYLAIALIVALYALLAKVVPAIHIGGLVDFDKTTADRAPARAARVLERARARPRDGRADRPAPRRRRDPHARARASGPWLSHRSSSSRSG